MVYYINFEPLKNHNRLSCFFRDNNNNFIDFLVYGDNRAMQCINQTNFLNNGLFPIKNNNIRLLDSLIQVFFKTDKIKEIDTLELTEEEIVSIAKRQRKTPPNQPTRPPLPRQQSKQFFYQPAKP